MKKILCILMIVLSCAFNMYAQDINVHKVSLTVEFIVNTDTIINNEE